MLVLSRKKDEGVEVNGIVFRILQTGSVVRVGITAPPHMQINRIDADRVIQNTKKRGVTTAQAKANGAPF